MYDWIIKAQTEISPEIIQKSIQKYGISKNLEGTGIYVLIMLIMVLTEEMNQNSITCQKL